MTQTQLVGLAIRLLALWLIFYLLRDGTAFLYALTNYGEAESFRTAGLLIMGVLILIALMLLRFPHPLANLLLPGGGEREVEWKLTIEDIQTVAFTILGMIILVTSIPSLFYWLTVLAFSDQSGQTDSQLLLQQLARIIAGIIQIGMGFWLLLGAIGLKGLLYRLRNAGVE